MARDFAQIRLSIWNDDDFRALTPPAQHLYFLLISSPGLSYCGVGDWRPGRLSGMAASWSRAMVEKAAAELIDRLFILVDEDTEEFLVRSYVRNDPLMKQPNLGTSMARAFALVGSTGIRGVIVHELKRLKKEAPELAGWRSGEASGLLDKVAIDPRSYPCGNPRGEGSVDPSVDPQFHPSGDPSVDPSIDPQIDPSVKGESKGAIDPSGDPSNDPSVDPSHTTATSTYNLSTGGLLTVSSEGHARAGETDSPSPEISSEVDAALDALASTAPRRSAPVPVPDDVPADPRAARCSAHVGVDDPGPCGPCGGARRAAERDAAARFEAGRREAERRRAERAACDLCDDGGWIFDTNPVVKCEHDPEANSVTLSAVEAERAQREAEERAERERRAAEFANRSAAGF